ncbi:MAG: ABC transporter transmembrane domain-containing protein, partial [Parcubacteria group bacterium]
MSQNSVKAEEIATLAPSEGTPQPPSIKGTFDLLLRFNSLLQPYRLECFGIWVGIMLQVALYVLYPLGFQVIFDKVIPYKNSMLLIKIMAGLGALLIVCGGAAIFQSLLVARVGSAILRDLRLRMFDQLNQLSSSFFMRVDSADILSRFSFEIASVELALTRALPAIVECLLVVLACLGTICIIDWRITLVALVLLPLGFISAKIIGPRADILTSERTFCETRMLGVLYESLLLRPIIRALGIEMERRRHFEVRNNELSHTSSKLGFAASLIGISSLYSINILLVAIVGA